MVNDRAISFHRAVPWLLMGAVAAAAALMVHLGCGEAGKSVSRAAPRFVPGDACSRCHQTQHQDWLHSHHDLAMQEVALETVLGDFNDATFTHHGVTSRFYKKDDAHWVRTDGPDGKMHDYRVRYVFGVDPLQQYLIEFPGGRLQALTIAWDVKGKRWYSLYPDEKIPHDDPLHWTGPNFNWNFMCADCHPTHVDKGYDHASKTYKTTFTHLDVSCQACHGPGSDHIAWAEAAAKGAAPTDATKGLRVTLKGADSKTQVESCARCHARRHLLRGVYVHGKPLLDTHQPQLLLENLYYPDGQIQDEVYVYGSFVQSKMYHHGVKCTDCHNPHSVKPLAQGNALCVRCHNPQPPVGQFKTLKPFVYDSPAHHHHEPGTPGAQCVNCHMPDKHYMVVDPRRDHSFRVPRPDLTLKLGVPNACDDCHKDKGTAWSAEAVKKWFPAGRSGTSHFAEALAEARARKPAAGPKLVALAQDPNQRPIVRATALYHLRAHGDRSALMALVSGIGDDDPLVRVTAVGGLDRLPAAQRWQALNHLLDDPIRAVRQETARVLADVPEQAMGDRAAAFAAALAEYRDTQQALLDRPGAHLNLAVLHSNRGRPDRAEQAYRDALALDPNFVPALVNLAHLYNQMGRNAEAEKIFKQIIARDPANGEAAYALGLLLAEMNRLEDAALYLGRAAQQLSRRQRVHYNHSLALQRLNRFDAAEVAMLRAYRIDPENPDVLVALADLYVKTQRFEDARPYVEILKRRAPDAPIVQELDRKIQAGTTDN